MRDEFPIHIRQILAERVAYTCSNPACQRLTVGPHSLPDKPLKIGRSAHIKAASAGGPRYDPQQTAEDRTSIENGIWLCAICADIIDKDVVNHPASLLLTWKAKAESTVLKRLQGEIQPDENVMIEGSIDRRLQISRLLDEAFDILAGKCFSTRITRRKITPDRRERARRIISEAATIDPSNDKLQLIQSLYFLACGYPERALEGLNKIKNDSLEMTLELANACCFYDMGRESDFVQIMERLSGDPKPPAAVFYNLGAAKYKSKEIDAADHFFRKALEVDENYPEALDRLAQIAFEKGDLNGAVTLSARAYALFPDDEFILVHYAFLLLEQKRTQEALEILEPASKMFPASADVFNYLGRAYGESGNLSRGERCLRRALDLSPTDPIALQNLGIILALTGRFMEARQIFDDSLKYEHPYPDQIMKNLAALEVLSERFKKC